MALAEITPDQLKLDLKSQLQQYITILTNDEEKDPQRIQKLYNEMAQAAHDLHMILKREGNEPKHHAYMKRNRGVSADEVSFYRHIHPVQDLLSFLEDAHANDDPADKTIGVKFIFSVFSRRWNRKDDYELVRTSIGWNISYMGIGGPCNWGGNPYLFKNLRQDSIEYPEALDEWLEWVWKQAAYQGLSREEVQSAISQLADWVSEIERSSPSGGLWQGYKG